jgi:hypothetical protein
VHTVKLQLQTLSNLDARRKIIRIKNTCEVTL